MRRTLLALSLTLALLLAGAGTAVAADVTVHDGTGDTWGQTPVSGPSATPGNTVGDLTAMRLTHTRSRIRVVLRLVKLSRTGRYANYTVRLEAKGSGLVREVVLQAGPRSWAGSVRMYDAHGRSVRCDTGHRIDYRQDRVVLSVARGCLDRPRRVRANANTNLVADTGVFYADNPHNACARSQAWSPWVRAG